MGLDKSAAGIAIGMASPLENGPPTSVANITPPTGEGQARTAFETFKDTLSEIKTDVRELRKGLVVGFLILAAALVAGFLILAGMLVDGYLKLEAKIDGLSTPLTRVETKLDDAIQRNALQPPRK